MPLTYDDITIEYDYSFSVWPVEKAFTKQTYDLFRMLKNRIEMTLTPAEFEAFRSAVNRDGLTLREISRVPHHEPEGVF